MHPETGEFHTDNHAWVTYCVHCRCVIAPPYERHLDVCPAKGSRKAVEIDFQSEKTEETMQVDRDERLTVTLTGMDGDRLVVDGREPPQHVQEAVASFSRAEKAALLALVREVTRALEGGRVSGGIIGGTLLSRGGIITNPGTSVVAGGQPQ